MTKVRPNKIFPGRVEFAAELYKQVPTKKDALGRFLKKLDALVDKRATAYIRSVVKRNEAARIPRKSTTSAIDNLSYALKSVSTTPFSTIASQFVDIKTGELTELGKHVAMPPDVAAQINGPNSSLTRLIIELEAEGVSCSDLVAASYTSFDYARSAITAHSAAAAPPIAWLPLGNAIFTTTVLDHARQSPQDITIINLGAGPGALEQVLAQHLGETAKRIRVIATETDQRSIVSLKSKNVPFALTVVEGDFTRRETLEQVVRKVKGIPFIVAGYSFHHILPTEVKKLVAWMNTTGGHIQIHDVNGGENGGGQSPVNRVFFNLMLYYHLSIFHPDKTYNEGGLAKMAPHEGARRVEIYRDIFYNCAAPADARTMLENGSIAVFTK